MADSNRQCLLRGNLMYGTQSVGTLTIKGDQNTFGLPNKIMGVVMQKRGQPGDAEAAPAPAWASRGPPWALVKNRIET